ncbi:MAG: hypothetical protein QMC89_02300 [Candidatus Hodarchaeaceae archaeon]|nr:hypothetical protein [Candidatus Hodarchaeaceae archaeon]
MKMRDAILGFAKGRPLFGAPGVAAPDIGQEILKELRKIRKVVEK